MSTMMFNSQNMRLEDEIRLIERAKSNPNHFGPLYSKYHDAVFRYVAKRVDEEEIAYDITSGVFVKALTNISKYEYRGIPFASWLFRIAKSELYQSFRDKKAEKTVCLDKVVLGQFLEEVEEDNSEEMRARLVKAISKLKPAQIELIEMRFFEKRSFREMGEILGLTENNTKVKTFRTLNKLKEILEKSAFTYC